MNSISIIIPVYNVEQYIHRCLESIIEQSIENVRIECILVDDCSPDKSMDIVQKIADDYHGEIQFKMLRHKENRGVSSLLEILVSNMHRAITFFLLTLTITYFQTASLYLLNN